MTIGSANGRRKGAMTAASDKKIHILSVEDSSADMRLISEILSMSKLKSEVEFVRDGIEALDFLYQRGPFVDARRPDLILLDLTLPKLDGHDVLKVIKEDATLKTIPVLVLSGSKSRDDINKSYEMHANTYIVKPFDLEELTSVVKGIEDYWMKIAQLPFSLGEREDEVAIAAQRYRIAFGDGDLGSR